MAAIDSGGGNSGKKAVNQEIPLIPFIDLLLCCVMFLLATAVWNQLAAMNANQQVPGQASTEDAPPEDEKVKLILQVRNSGYVLGSSAGESIDIKKRAVAEQKEFDVEELSTKLGQWKQAWDTRDDLIVAPEDGGNLMIKAYIAVVVGGWGSIRNDDRCRIRRSAAARSAATCCASGRAQTGEAPACRCRAGRKRVTPRQPPGAARCHQFLR